jgi:hypothetical protein
MGVNYCVETGYGLFLTDDEMMIFARKMCEEGGQKCQLPATEVAGLQRNNPTITSLQLAQIRRTRFGLLGVPKWRSAS